MYNQYAHLIYFYTWHEMWTAGLDCSRIIKKKNKQTNNEITLIIRLSHVSPHSTPNSLNFIKFIIISGKKHFSFH